MKWFLLIIPFFLQSCSNLPAKIKNPPTANIQLDHVLAESNHFQNAPVRWGGTVIEVENEKNLSNMQILFYPLDYYGRPKTHKPSLGRFIITSKQFLDPAIYRKDTQITVAGTLQGIAKKQIGKKQIIMPIVALDTQHLWPKQQTTTLYDYSPYYNSYGYGFNYQTRYYPYHYYRGGYNSYNCY